MVRLSGGWSEARDARGDGRDRVAQRRPRSPRARPRQRLIAAVHADLRERGIELLTLAVFAGNEPAARLYARFGMQPVLTHMIGRVPGTTAL